jgi:cation-transporting P-type ATPase C
MLLNDYTVASMTTGLLPIPLADVAALTGVQFRLIHKIGKLYGEKIPAYRARALITSLVGGSVPLASLSAASLTKLIPGFGTTAGTVGMVTMGGASTYALGRVLIRHYESGRNLDEFSATSASALFSEELAAGTRLVRQLKKSRRAAPSHTHDHTHDHYHGPSANVDFIHRHDHGHDDHAHESGGSHSCGHSHDHDNHAHDHHDHGHGAACADDSCGHDHATDDLTIAKYKHQIYLGSGTLLVLGAQRLFLPALVAGAAPVFIIAATATFMTGHSYISGLWSSITKRKINSDTLVGTATVASLALGSGLTALSVLVLLNIGTYFESVTLRKTNKAIRDLLEIDENEEVWLVTQTESGQHLEVRRKLSTITPADTVAVYAGQRVPVDGYVIDGGAQVNPAPITGEERPVDLKKGDLVYAGYIVLGGKLTVKVKKVGQDTVVGRIIERVHQAEEVRPPIQTVGEEFSRRFVPFSFAMAGGVFLLTLDPTRALTMLLIACPCAVGLSTPTAVSASVGNSAKRGILVRGGSFFEATAQADVMVFDKTGTLTNGVPTVARIVCFNDAFDEQGLLAMAASAELHSNHPLGAAIVSHAKEMGVEIASPLSHQSIDGSGIRAAWNDGSAFVGNQALMEHFGIEIPDQAKADYSRFSLWGETVLFVAFDAHCVGLIGIRNNIRPHVADTLEQLRRRGIDRVIMLTGDQEQAARLAAKSAGIEEWRSRLMPEDKYRFVRELQASGHKVIMIGDGINDAPALAIADVGIAIGTGGSDVAIESSDIALSSEDFRKLDEVLQVSNKTITTIRQNYGMALVINAGGLVVAAMGMINPFAAVVLHNVSTAAVLINSSRLVGYQPDSLEKAAKNGKTLGQRLKAINGNRKNVKPEAEDTRSETAVAPEVAPEVAPVEPRFAEAVGSQQ